MAQFEFSVTWARRDWKRKHPDRRTFSSDLARAERFIDKLRLRYSDLTMVRLERREVGPWIETTKSDCEDIRRMWAAWKRARVS